VRRRQSERAVLIVGRNIFAIGLIDHQQDIARQGGVEPGDVSAWQVAPGGIVRVGEKNHPCPFVHKCQQRIDISAIVGVGRHHRRRAAAAGSNVID